ncbi:MAG: hypothetical protein M1837_005198 [Sclerophora amabilis]|nr:MAG: hypothetical protein M1837_005198 [Sclerophora amabilis]
MSANAINSPHNPNNRPPLLTTQTSTTPPTTLTTPTGPTPTTKTSHTHHDLPAPSTFDILPPLHTLLSRLLPNSPNNTAGNTQTGTGSSRDLTGPPLEPHQLTTEATALKIRVQKARAAVEALPDVNRTVEEQEAEIRELEGKVEGLRTLLRGLKGA